METKTQIFSEWSASTLRPIARWVSVTDEHGRSRLEMRWQAPDADLALANTTRSAWLATGGSGIK